MRAAQELLGVLTIGGGSAQQGVVVEGVKEVKYAFQAAQNVGPFTALNPKRVWLLKSLIRSA